MKKRKSLKAAIVAAARKLAEAVWRLFALSEAFDLARLFGGPQTPWLPPEVQLDQTRWIER